MRVFISYSSKIRPQVAALESDLEEAGYQVWFDQELSGGQAWWSEILKNLSDCDAFVLALTPQTLDSEPCRRELHYALALGKPILPVMLAEVDLAAMPPALSQLQVIDYRKRDADAVLKLTRALNLFPPTPALPDPLPPEPDVPLSPLSKLREQIDAASLNELEQREILGHFRSLMEAGETDAQPLFERFLGRHDLLASVGHDARSIRLRRSPRRRLKLSRRVWLSAIALTAAVIVAIVLIVRSSDRYDPVSSVIEDYTLTVAGTPGISVAGESISKWASTYPKFFAIAPGVEVQVQTFGGWEQHLSTNGFSLYLPYENLDGRYLGVMDLKIQDGSTAKSLRAMAQESVTSCRALGYTDTAIYNDEPGEAIIEKVNANCRPLGRTDQDFPAMVKFKFIRLTNGQVVVLTLILDENADLLSDAAHDASGAMEDMASSLQFFVTEATPETTAEITPDG